LLKSDIFSWRGKSQIAAEFFRPSQTDGSADESLASFVRRRFGTEALERMAQPMVGGIYTANPEQLSLRATFPRFLEWEQKYGSVIRALRRRETGAISDKSLSTQESSGARYSLFVSFDAGMQVLTDELARRLPTKAVRTNCRVNSLHVDRQTSRWRVETEHGTLEADAICLTTPAYVSAELLRETHSALASALQNIPYESSATINLAYKRSDVAHALNGFGFVVPFIEGLSLIACTFSSVKFAGRAPNKHVLLRAFVGGALQRDIMQLEDGELLRRVQQDLSALLQISNPPLFTTVARWERAMPQYHVGHLERVETIRRYERELPGLTLAGAAYSGVGIPDCVRSGEAAAEVMVSDK
jgi:oxygen-dependent protoporphyrinogen oxidase